MNQPGSTAARRRSAFGAFVGALVVLGAATFVGAVENVSFEVERVEGAGWSAEGVAIRLDLPPNSAGAAIEVARLRLPAVKQTLANIAIRCPSVEISADVIACSRARIDGVLGDFGRQSLSGHLRYARSNGDVEGEIGGLRLGQGEVKVSGALSESGWQGRAQLDRVGIEQLLKYAAALDMSLPPLSGTGSVTATINASGANATLEKASVNAAVADVTLSNEAGSIATEKFSAHVDGAATNRRGDWDFQASVKSSSGQAYMQPIFLDLGAHALAMTTRGTWKQNSALQLDHFSVDHRDVVQGAGSAHIDLAAEQPLRTLHLKLGALRFPGAYSTYFQPLLLDTPFKSLTSTGAIAGEIAIADGAPKRIDLQFDRVTLDDGARDFVLHDLDGTLHWLDDPAAAVSSDADDDDDDTDPEIARDSRLSWTRGTLLNLDLGGGALHFRTQARQLRLLEPARIPILDGSLDLESLRIRNAGLPGMAFIIDAVIQPISVSQLCRAFGWPEFGGQIAGKISKLRVRQRVATLGTTLEANVFDGVVKISDLRLDQPFSDWPRFYSNIALDNLDLALVTSAFSFGGITGRLSGEIKGLELFNWSPTAFDARLYTPLTDRSRHRISQRAVENIGSIGGGGAGVTAALSGGVLRFFDDFNYDRLGLSCRLENDVCHMDGVAPAPNGGYYLVKGKGLPRIDVIGGARRVDWPRLVQQLIAVTESEGPVVN